ncbi:MAG TPA: type VI secretion system protein TssA [Candidatus Saccharimonadales bacterium]|nr:type VI secretion system protein TssA [Candidatus Saccharimonadales bacterium]
MNHDHPFRFDVSGLLQPISSRYPGGELLRYEGTYDLIKQARQEDDPRLEQGVWKKNLKRADWNQVSRLCLNALQERSKDLQIAAWLLESWLHLYGFAGVRAGCDVVAALCRTFWDSMHPSLEDTDYRIAPIHWMNEKLYIKLKLAPITSPHSETSNMAYTLADWETASMVEQSKHRPDAPKGPGLVTPEMIQQSASLSPGAFFEQLMGDVSEACHLCDEVEARFEKELGADKCSLSQFRGVLEQVLLLTSQFSGSKLMLEPSREMEEAMQPEYESEVISINAEQGMARPIRSREEAYRRASEVADFLVRNEPHSPAGHLIRRAISWGHMTLEQLLPELVEHENTLKDLERLLNIQTVPKGRD